MTKKQTARLWHVAILCYASTWCRG